MIGTGEGDSPGAQGPPLRSGHPADTSPVKAEGKHSNSDHQEHWFLFLFCQQCERNLFFLCSGKKGLLRIWAGSQENVEVRLRPRPTALSLMWFLGPPTSSPFVSFHKTHFAHFVLFNFPSSSFCSSSPLGRS